MDEVTVDIEKTGAGFIGGNDVVVPDLVIESTRCAHGCHPSDVGIEGIVWSAAALPVHRGSGATKSAVQSAGNARKEACRQTLVVLQHKNIRREASEF
jgi:hypothetical protein